MDFNIRLHYSVLCYAGNKDFLSGSESFPDSLLSISGMESLSHGAVLLWMVLEKRLSSDVDFQIISVWAINNHMHHCIFGLGWRGMGVGVNPLLFPARIED
uniref:Uncharacterized protein n=1 Tax=Malurus cyaneus samueli TaxID=2593467 RepID=A0A8C5X6S2_9PASS